MAPAEGAALSGAVELRYAGAVSAEGPSDEELMLRYCDGDAGAFETLYRRHRGALYRYFLRQCGEPAVAEELFQDVWLRVIGARRRYRVTARFTTWLYTLAHHRLVDHHRARGRSPLEADGEALASVPDPAPDLERTLDERRLATRLLELVAALPREQREAWLLREEAGLGLAAIAEATGVGRETVKSRLRYATGRLRRGLGIER